MKIRTPLLTAAALTALLAMGCAQDAETPETPAPELPTAPVDPDLLSDETLAFQKRYSAQLKEAADWEYTDLTTHYAPGTKNADLGYDPSASGFLDKITAAFELTGAELDRIDANGFMVSERKSWNTFAWAYESVYVAELPLLITTDSVLHALHRSFDEILKVAESEVISPKLDTLLSQTHQALAGLAAPGDLADAARDVDIFLTMARSLLAGAPVASLAGGEVDTFVAELLVGTKEKRLMDVTLFGAERKIDFSQFEPRGHYEESEVLQRYFRAMMWLGRIDFRLREYDPYQGKFLWRDRQIRGGYLLHAAVQAAEVGQVWTDISELIGTLIGPPDAMDMTGWDALVADAGLTSPADLAGDLSALQTQIQAGRYGNQRINSHWLTTNPMSSEVTPLPLSFAFMGQRFVVDSTVFSNVVYDRIVHEETKVPRALPKPLDAMFVLGANEALPLLQDEIDSYNYAPNLHALRYLVDDYDGGFWTESVYNMWLSGIRGMNTLPEGALPTAMSTDAWAHKALHTQLASWAELRHDTLLYAKQSYTGGIGCEYPDGFVEPYPEVYANLGKVAGRIAETLGKMPFENQWTADRVATWASDFGATMQHLESMAHKELAEEPFDPVELDLIATWLKHPDEGVCGGPSFTGLYPRLFFNEMHAEELDPTVADVHTNPNSDGPMAPQRVLHVGTGAVNLMVLTRNSCEGSRAYAGPVSSYYEIEELGMDRLTDSEWAERLQQVEAPARPAWTASFMVPK
ncbi:MAG: hypothetical protein ACI9WU_005350 [Myxococcota bacterium]|jgi:hypothetical protein